LTSNKISFGATIRQQRSTSVIGKVFIAFQVSSDLVSASVGWTASICFTAASALIKFGASADAKTAGYGFLITLICSLSSKTSTVITPGDSSA
jgi:hypothetical protein